MEENKEDHERLMLFFNKLLDLKAEIDAMDEPVAKMIYTKLDEIIKEAK